MLGAQNKLQVGTPQDVSLVPDNGVAKLNAVGGLRKENSKFNINMNKIPVVR
jgi:hypothetical protein